MHNNLGLEKVTKFSLIKMGMLLQPYTSVSSVQVKQREFLLTAEEARSDLSFSVPTAFFWLHLNAENKQANVTM